MSILLELSPGDLVFDLDIDTHPTLCNNLLKLCRSKYYNFSPVSNVQPGFTFQTGDPLAFHKSSVGGTSFQGHLSGNAEDRLLRVPDEEAEVRDGHEERGTLSMVCVVDKTGGKWIASQFIVTLGDKLSEQLDTRCVPIGRLVEGFDTLEKINGAFCDDKGRPLRDIRIRHTHVLEDPFPDPDGWRERSSSPPPTEEQLSTVRIGEDEELDEDEDEETKERRRREKEAQAQALTLEIVGDLPFADVAPPENVLFVCKLNPVTTDADLELIFSRFGKILSCEVIRDKKTGDSLQYAFIEYENKDSAEQAYFKMQGVLIDDCRIHVDFSQSVSKLAKPFLERKTPRARGKGGSSGGGRYGGGRSEEMVFDEEEMAARGDRNGSRRTRSRSRSPRRDGRRDRNRDRDRERDRGQRYHDDNRNRERPRHRERDGYDRDRRDRSRDRERRERRRSGRDYERQRSRSRSVDRHRERDRRR